MCWVRFKGAKKFHTSYDNVAASHADEELEKVCVRERFIKRSLISNPCEQHLNEIPVSNIYGQLKQALGRFPLIVAGGRIV